MKMEMMVPSTVTYRYNFQKSFVDSKGKKHSMREELIDGQKGLYFKFVHLKGDKFSKVMVKEEGKDKFLVMTKEGDKEDKKTIDSKKLKAMIKDHKHLKFVAEYMKSKDKGEYKAVGGGSCNTKHTSTKRKSRKSKKSRKSRKSKSGAARKARKSRKSTKRKSRKSTKRKSRKSKSGAARKARKSRKSTKRKSRKSTKRKSRKS